MREARRVEDPYNGRVWLDWAYAMGCLDAIGDDQAHTLFDKVLEIQAARRAIRHALVTQFRMGQEHERARGTIPGDCNLRRVRRRTGLE